MQIQVSLTIEIEANAGILEMEDQIQKAGHQAMKQPSGSGRKSTRSVRTVGKSSGGWKERCAGSSAPALDACRCRVGVFAVCPVGGAAAQPITCLPGS